MVFIFKEDKCGSNKGGSREPLEIRIKIVRNGVMVCAYRGEEQTKQEYVYADIKATQRYSFIVSVLKEDAPKTTMSDLDAEEESINKKEN